eukprot:jgi/Tetstr1/449919/TSEL_036973.t1
MAAPFVAGAAALYLQAHPTATLREVRNFLLDTATTGEVSGLSAAVFNQQGFGDQWDSFAANSPGVKDDAANVESSPNKLLHLSAFQSGGLETCPDDTGFSKWITTEACPPRNSEVCGSTSHSVPGAEGLNWPLSKRTRTCEASDCACNPGAPLTTYDSCAPTGTEYVYLNCGVPTAEVNTVAELRWLEGKTLRYSPDTDSTFDVCHKPNPGGALPIPTDRAQSFGKYMRDDGFLKISFPAGWTFRFMGAEWPSVRIASNGYLLFTNSYPKSAPAGGSLQEQVSAAKGAGVSAFFTDLNPEAGGCGYDSCGNVLMFCQFSAEGQRTCALTFADVPVNAGGDTNNASTFQFVLHMDGTGIVEVSYLTLSSAAIGHVSVGISPATDSADSTYNPRYSPSCSAA